MTISFDPTRRPNLNHPDCHGPQGAGGRESHAFGVPEPGATTSLPPRAIERRDDGTLWSGTRKVMGWADGGKVADPTQPRTGDEKKPEPPAAKPSRKVP